MAGLNVGKRYSSSHLPLYPRGRTMRHSVRDAHHHWDCCRRNLLVFVPACNSCECTACVLEGSTLQQLDNSDCSHRLPLLFSPTNSGMDIDVQQAAGSWTCWKGPDWREYLCVHEQSTSKAHCQAQLITHLIKPWRRSRKVSQTPPLTLHRD